MLTFSEDQYGQINEAYQEQQPRRFLRRLRECDDPVPSEMPDEEALRVIRQAVGEGKQLYIEEDEDILRFLRLVFWRWRHSIDYRTSDLIAMTLGNIEAPPKDRLDFIEKRFLRNEHL